MSDRTLSRIGILGFVTGLLGAAAGVLLLAWPPQVSDTLVSYPFTDTGFRVVQALFAVHHLGLVAVLIGLAVSGATGPRRAFRWAAWLAVAGMIGLTGTEILAMRYAGWDFDTANAGTMGAAYGISCNVVGVGALVAGVGVARSRVWTGWRRWTPLAIGVSLFVVVTPGLFAGFVAARLVIGFWMLLFGALGWALYAESSVSAEREARVGRSNDIPAVT